MIKFKNGMRGLITLRNALYRHLVRATYAGKSEIFSHEAMLKYLTDYAKGTKTYQNKTATELAKNLETIIQNMQTNPQDLQDMLEIEKKRYEYRLETKAIAQEKRILELNYQARLLYKEITYMQSKINDIQDANLRDIFMQKLHLAQKKINKLQDLIDTVKQEQRLNLRPKKLNLVNDNIFGSLQTFAATVNNSEQKKVLSKQVKREQSQIYRLNSGLLAKAQEILDRKLEKIKQENDELLSTVSPQEIGALTDNSFTYRKFKIHSFKMARIIANSRNKTNKKWNTQEKSLRAVGDFIKGKIRVFSRKIGELSHSKFGKMARNTLLAMVTAGSLAFLYNRYATQDNKENENGQGADDSGEKIVQEFTDDVFQKKEINEHENKVVGKINDKIADITDDQAHSSIKFFESKAEAHSNKPAKIETKPRITPIYEAVTAKEEIKEIPNIYDMVPFETNGCEDKVDLPEPQYIVEKPEVSDEVNCPPQSIFEASLPDPVFQFETPEICEPVPLAAPSEFIEWNLPEPTFESSVLLENPSEELEQKTETLNESGEVPSNESGKNDYFELPSEALSCFYNQTQNTI
jgi:hypothetical protein